MEDATTTTEASWTAPFETETLDEIPEPFRGLYEPSDDGKFRVKVAGAVPEHQLERERKALMTNRDKALKELENYRRKYGNIDPDRYQELLEEHEKREQELAEQKGNWEELRQRLEQKSQEKLAAAQEEIERSRRQIQTLLFEQEATKELMAEKGEPTLLIPHLRSRVKFEEDNGETRMVILTKDGRPMISDKGEPGTMKDLVRELKMDDVFGRGFSGSGAAGGGSKGSGRTPSIKNPWQKDTLNLTLQAQLQRENPALASQLRAEAGLED